MTALRAMNDQTFVSLPPAREPPHNLDAERGVLGAILMDGRSYDKVSSYLQPEHFYEPVHGDIFGVMKTLIDGGFRATPVTMRDPLARNDRYNASGGAKFLVGLSSSAVTSINAGDYGKLVYRHAMQRSLIELFEDSISQAYDLEQDETPQSLAEETISRAAELLTNDVGTAGPVSIASAVQRALKRHESVDRGDVQGISSGLRNLDRAQGLMQDGDLIIWAGRPSMGKSALASTISYLVAEAFQARALREGAKPKHVLVFSQEMTEDQNADRTIAGVTGIAAPRNRIGQLNAPSWRRLIEFAEQISNLPLHVDERPRATLSRIRAECRKMQRRGGVGLVVVDYLQIMGLERTQRSNNRTQELGYLATGLKDLAKELRCPVIALSQLNRGVEQRDDKRPGLSDLRESGEIEQAADVVGFCYREEYYLERSEPKAKPDESDDKFHQRYSRWVEQRTKAEGKADVIFAKARSGDLGTAKLLFDAPRTWFSDDDGGSHPPTRHANNKMPDGRDEPPTDMGM